MRVIGGPVSGEGGKVSIFVVISMNFVTGLGLLRGIFYILQTPRFLSSDLGVGRLYASFLAPPLSMKKILSTT